MTFKNENGKTYDIIDEEGDYTLLKEIKDHYEDYAQPYIVAFDLNKEEGYWSQGHYYSDLETAKETFEHKTS